MPKPKNRRKQKHAVPKLPPERGDAKPVSTSQSLRETVESIVIAFVLAFLFRTFEAEAFVIPTGSMAPTLMGRHKDVDCAQCGHRFQVNTSDEDPDSVMQLLRRPDVHSKDDAKCIAGTCPNCRFPMAFQPNLPVSPPTAQLQQPVKRNSSYNGDRILVNKYIYSFKPPERWDVVVFKYPGNAPMNYIKRLVGLPNETLRVYQGDVFAGDDGARTDSDFRIARKPPNKVLAMRQLVHDTQHDPVVLHEAGWPLRWQNADGGWNSQQQVEGVTVRQSFASDSATDGMKWIRYQHLVPGYDDWQQATRLQAKGLQFPPGDQAPWHPQLISDFNSYNTAVHVYEARESQSLRTNPKHWEYHWVGDLIVEAALEVEAAQGELELELVEAGRRFTCRIDLASGQARLAIEGVENFAPMAPTALNQRGHHELIFANVDDQLLLWVDGAVVDFDTETTYDADVVYGDRRDLKPHSGDLSPVGIGAAGAEVEVSRLQVWRDIYYIASDWKHTSGAGVNDSYDFRPSQRHLYLTDPASWDIYLSRRHVDFALGADQYFVMGDNSPASLDARLWPGGNARSHGHPGGPYLERDLLIGKALCVYWPHSWNRIPGTPIPLPLFPNFQDMRLVR